MKVLIIRLSSIGDIIFTTPVIRCVKQQLPNSEVHFLVKQKFKAVLNGNPYIDKLHVLSDSFKETADILKQENFDIVIDLHKNLRTLRLKVSIGGKWYSYNKESVEKFLLTKFGINKMSGIHITQRSLNAVKPLGVKDDGLGLDYYIDDSNKVNIATHLGSNYQNGYIAVVIGASFATKKMPVTKLQKLASLIKYPIVLIGAKEEYDDAEIIVQADSKRIFNACGKFNLQQSGSLVQQAKLVISHDTGFQYIACAFQKPVIAIWGATSPKLDVEPYYGSSIKNPPYYNSIVPNLKCQPCSNYGTKTCPEKHFNCMEHQDLSQISSLANIWFDK